MISYKEKLKKITCFIFDVDGVLTDGNVYLFKDEIVRAINSKDAYALQYGSKMGFRTFIISGGNSEEVKTRLLEFGVTEVHLSTHNKLACYEDIKKRFKLVDEEILYMGDDIPDIPVLKKVAVSSCPQDAAIDVKKIVTYQSPIDGGKGCVRELMEQTLRVQGKWLSEKAFEW